MSTRAWLKELAVVALFVAIAVLAFFGRWQGVTPFPSLRSDAGNVAGFAAARDFPELFQQDEVLGDSRNFQVYQALQVHLVRLLARIAPDYGTATLLLLIPYVFLIGWGSYFLGRVVVGHRGWAVLLGLFNLILVLSPFSYWGVYRDPQTRMSSQAVLPFLLAAVFHWRKNPKAWPLVAVGASLLTYFHAVAGIVWGAAILFGFFTTSFGRGWLRSRETRFALIAVLAYVGGLLPFLVAYLGAHEQGSTIQGYSTVYGIMEARFADGYLNIPLAVHKLIVFWRGSAARLGFGILGVGSLLYSICTKKAVRSNHDMPRLIAAWLIAVVGISIGLPLIEQSIARSLQMIPTQVDLIRGVRFVIPLLLLLIVWTLSRLSLRTNRHLMTKDWLARACGTFLLAMLSATVALVILQKTTNVLHVESFLGLPGVCWITLSIAVSIGALAFISSFLCRARRWRWVFSPMLVLSMGTLLLGAWTYAHYEDYGLSKLLVRELSCLRQGKAFCAEPELLAEHALLGAVSQHVPAGAAVLSSTEKLSIRYIAMRPVVYTYKDGGILAYCNHSALVEWNRRRHLVEAALGGYSPEQVVEGLATVARSLGAAYLIVNFQISADRSEIIDVVWRNEQYAILRIKDDWLP
jgi:hypothetical protein